MNGQHPVVSVRTYVGVFVALIALTITTVAVSKLELGELNFVAAMTIAVAKGLLVVLFFMDVRHAASMTKLFIGAALFWLALLLVGTLTDYKSRNWLPGGRWWTQDTRREAGDDRVSRLRDLPYETNSRRSSIQ
jgi:cytochrome c oxidase subunit IV